MRKQFYEKEEKSGEVKKLKKVIKKLEHEITRLKSELRTYDKVFNRNIEFLKKEVDGVSLEDLIHGVNDGMDLPEIKKELSVKELTDKWKCYKCEDGVLKFMIIPNNKYFRSCTKCSHRTEVKELHNEVER